MNPLKKKHRDDKSLLQGAQILLTLAVAIGVLFSSAPTADGFMAFDHQLKPHLKRKLNNLIRRVHKQQWVIGYAYADPEWGEPAGVCPPEARHNGAAIEAAITDALRAWLLPVKDLNTGKPVVDDFRFVPNFEVPPKDLADVLLYDLNIFFYCDFGKSHALTGADEAIPPAIQMHRGTDVDEHFEFTLLHEIGHSFGLLDTYRRKIPGEEFQVSRGGLLRTIGHQPSSVMSGLHISRPGPRRIGQDDKNGIVWLYKFYHENLPLEDCLFPDYELETSPDGCRAKSPLIFEIKYGPDERFPIKVIAEDRNTDVNAKDETGSTALHHALAQGYSRLLGKLLSHSDLDVNARNAEGSTALFWAAKRGSYGVTERLLKHRKIDVNIRNTAGTTPLKAAAMQENDRIVELLLEQEPRERDWTEVDKTAPAHHRSVFYLLHAPRRLMFHVGYLGSVLGDGALFVAQNREGASIENYLSQTLVSHAGVVAEDIEVREVASFPGVDGESGSVLLAIRNVDLSAYQPLLVSTDPILRETEVEVLTYKFGSGIALEGEEKRNALNFPLQVRACVSVPHAGLGAKGLWQHTCGPANSVASGSLLFDKEKGTLIGFYTQQEIEEILGDGLPLASGISEAVIHLVDAKPVSPKNRLTTTWAALKMKE